METTLTQNFLLFAHRKSKYSVDALKWIMTNIRVFPVKYIFVDDSIAQAILKDSRNKIKITHVPTLVVTEYNNYIKIEGLNEITNYLYSLQLKIEQIKQLQDQTVQELSKEEVSELNFLPNDTKNIIQLDSMPEEVVEPPKEIPLPIPPDKKKITDLQAHVERQKKEKEAFENKFKDVIKKQ